MTRDNSSVVLPFKGVKKLQPPANDPCFSVILEGKFSSGADREEFIQTVTSHGITFLRCASSPLPQPSGNDLSMLAQLARALSAVWSRQSSEERKP
jgi:hypothetical protein